MVGGGDQGSRGQGAEGLETAEAEAGSVSRKYLAGPVRTADVHPHTGLNLRLALWVTDHVGTMWCAYVFMGIGAGSLAGVFTGNAVLALACGAVSSYVLQLVLLPVIMVGQNVQQAHADALSEQNHAMLTEVLSRLPEGKR